MSYASGGLIQAADFNGIANGTSGANIAWVWGTGYGNVGYGQSTTALTSLSSGAQVTAAQWSSMLAVLNNALGHQRGAGAQLGPLNYTTGQTITYFANVTGAASAINQAANIAAFSSQGTTATGGTFSPGIAAATATAYNAYYATRTVTFASGDAARYFFNAGGQLNLVIISVAVTTASARSNDAQTLIATNVGGFSAFRNTTGGGKTGTGGTTNTNSTTIGYRNLTTAQQTLVDITSSTASYTTDVANIRVRSNGTVGTAGDTGSIIYFDLGANFPAHGGFNDVLGVTVNHRIDIVPAESLYLITTYNPIIT
jgi:hypothetical protein